MRERVSSGKLAAAGAALTAATVLLAAPEPAHAVPSFARQTGMACEACHTVFPELTPFGRRFKLNGYVLTTKPQISDVNAQKQTTLSFSDLPPLSIMMQASSTWWNKAPPDTGGFAAKMQNGQVEFPQQLSLFYAGRIADHLGAFFQITYAQDAGTFGIDNSDVRYSDHTDDNAWVWGVTLNNNPSVQDVWNSTAAWGFPFFSPAGGTITPTASPFMQNLAQDTAGLGAYVFYKDAFYLEGTVYRTARPGVATIDSSALCPGGPPCSGAPTIDNYAPYWRAAYEYNWGKHSLTVGTSGMFARLAQPSGVTVSPGVVNDALDAGADVQYQYITDDHQVSFLGRYIHEKQDINSAAVAAGAFSNNSDSLNYTNLAATYYWRRKLGGSIGYTRVSGTADPAVYTKSLTGSPDSQWETFEVDYLPWLNTKLVLQYTLYNSFEGGSTYLEGNNLRKASDNNTTMLGIWTAF